MKVFVALISLYKNLFLWKHFIYSTSPLYLSTFISKYYLAMSELLHAEHRCAAASCPSLHRSTVNHSQSFHRLHQHN